MLAHRRLGFAVLVLLNGLSWMVAAEVSFPPRFPDDAASITVSGDELLRPAIEIKPGVTVAKVAPTVTAYLFPGQDYAGKPWSAWGDCVAVDGKFYGAIGDHLAPAGNAFVYEFDPATQKFRQLLDLKKLLQLPEGHYAPGKIHSRVDLGSDGWLYCSTHRGSTKVTTDQYHYQGDWIVRCHPQTGKSEVVANAPVGKHCIPCSVLDPQRLIFYGGSAPGNAADEDGGQFFAYDVKNRKLLFSGPNGPDRSIIFARSTGKVYYVPGKAGNSGGALVRFDPEKPGTPTKIQAELGLRAATEETPHGKVYTVSQAEKSNDAELFAFDTKSEKSEKLGPITVGSQQYIASLDVDSSGHYLYCVPGAHGGSSTDGSPIVQYDTRTKQRKILAFLNPLFESKFGLSLKGTYSTAVSEAGDRLYIIWNTSRGGKAWDCCLLTVVEIPTAERP